jgi:hypothetical protein
MTLTLGITLRLLYRDTRTASMMPVYRVPHRHYYGVMTRYQLTVDTLLPEIQHLGEDCPLLLNQFKKYLA